MGNQLEGQGKDPVLYPSISPSHIASCVRSPPRSRPIRVSCHESHPLAVRGQHPKVDEIKSEDHQTGHRYCWESLQESSLHSQSHHDCSRERGLVNTNIDTGNIDTVNMDTVNLNTVNSDTVNMDTVNLNTVNIDTVNMDTVNMDTVNIDTGNLDTPSDTNIDTEGYDTVNIDTLTIDTTSDTRFDTNQEGYTYTDLRTKINMFNSGNLESFCNNCMTIKMTSPLPKSSNEDSHSDAKENLEERRIHTETALTASIDWLSMSEPCFETLTEADQATRRLFYVNPTSVGDGGGCNQQTSNDTRSRIYNQQTSNDNSRVFNQQTSNDNSRVFNQQTNDGTNSLHYNQQSSDDNNRAFNQQTSDGNNNVYNSQTSDAKYHSYMHQTSEGTLIECGFLNNDNAINPSNHQKDSNSSGKIVNGDIGYPNSPSCSPKTTCSKSMITDTSMGQNGHWQNVAIGTKPTCSKSLSMPTDTSMKQNGHWQNVASSTKPTCSKSLITDTSMGLNGHWQNVAIGTKPTCSKSLSMPTDTSMKQNGHWQNVASSTKPTCSKSLITDTSMGQNGHWQNVAIGTTPTCSKSLSMPTDTSMKQNGHWQNVASSTKPTCSKSLITDTSMGQNGHWQNVAIGTKPTCSKSLSMPTDTSMGQNGHWQNVAIGTKPTCSKSLSMPTDTSMGQNGHWRQDAGAQQPDEEPCDLIEVSRQSLFANPRTGEQYIMVYGSSDVKDTFNLTGSAEKKTPRFSKRQKSSESPDGLSSIKDVSPGGWSIFKLSPTEHESERVFKYECEVGECLDSERTSGLDLSVSSHSTSSYGHSFEERVPNNDRRTVETLQRIIHEHSNGTVHVQAQPSPGEVHEQIQSVPCSVSELMEPFNSTHCEQTCQYQKHCIGRENLSKEYPESTFNNKHSTTAEETCVDKNDHNNLVDHEKYSDQVSLVGHSKPYETYTYNSDHVSLVGHSKPYETYVYNSDHANLVGHSTPYETHAHNNDKVDHSKSHELEAHNNHQVDHSKSHELQAHNNHQVDHSKSHELQAHNNHQVDHSKSHELQAHNNHQVDHSKSHELQAHNNHQVDHSKSHELQAHNSSHTCLVNHSKPHEAQAHNSDHNVFAYHPVPPAYSRWPSGLVATNPLVPAQSLPNNPFTTHYNPSYQTQSDQNKRRALYQNRRGLSINSLDLNSVATLPAANLVVQHGHCVACRTPSTRNLYLQDIMPVSPFIDSTPTTTTHNTDTTTNRTMYKKSLSADDANKLDFKVQNKFSPTIQTVNPLSPKMPPHCKIDDAEPVTRFLSSKNCSENGVKKRSISNESFGSRNERQMAHRSVSDNERQMADLIVNDNERQMADLIVSDNERHMAHRSVSDNEKQMAHRSVSDNERQMAHRSVSGNERQMAQRSINDSEILKTHRSISNNERQLAHRSVNVKYGRQTSDGSCDNLCEQEENNGAACQNPISRVSGPPMRSISQKNYLAYLCCAADNLTSFGLPFHRKLEDWGMSIFLAERDLELSGPKYDNMAKCVEERCNGKVIVILSKSYASSDECLFLTNFAKTLDPDSKRKNIIPVLIDKDVEIPNVLQGVSLIKYNYVCKHGWLKDKLISALAA